MRKFFAVIGMLVCAGLVVAGIMFVEGNMGGNTSTASSAPSYYNSGYATFGADFYTYVTNNAGEAASAVRTAAANLNHIARLLRNFCGAVLIGMGLIGFCGFGVALGSKPKAQTVPMMPPVPAAQPARRRSRSLRRTGAKRIPPRFDKTASAPDRPSSCRVLTPATGRSRRRRGERNLRGRNLKCMQKTAANLCKFAAVFAACFLMALRRCL